MGSPIKHSTLEAFERSLACSFFDRLEEISGYMMGIKQYNNLLLKVHKAECELSKFIDQHLPENIKLQYKQLNNKLNDLIADREVVAQNIFYEIAFKDGIKFSQLMDSTKILTLGYEQEVE